MHESSVSKSCPIYEKYSLTIEEAAEYFNIGQKTLYRLTDDHKQELDSFVLKVGKKTLIKRNKFIEFLDKTNEI